MKIVAIICRILLGLMFVVFGANLIHPFLHMDPMDPNLPSTKWSMLMMASGYMLHIGFFQILGGILVLIGRTAPLGLCILGPILVNILMFHHCLTGNHGIGLGLFATLLEVVLIYAYRANFAGIFALHAKPTTT